MNKVRCTKCNTELISKSVHDFQQCGCDNGTFCDGGNDYQRVGGKEWKYVETWSDEQQEWKNMGKMMEEQKKIVCKHLIETGEYPECGKEGEEVKATSCDEFCIGYEPDDSGFDLPDCHKDDCTYYRDEHILNCCLKYKAVCLENNYNYYKREEGKEEDDLHQCPCEPACKCRMNEPCLGCEEYGRWLVNREKKK